MKQDSRHAAPICPKCGYDQSGAIATWELQCPLEGRCPECGLDFQWCDVFDPASGDLGWYVEHGSSLWQIAKRTPGTLRRLALPHIYWRAVGVQTQIRLGSLCIWLILCALGLHLFVSIPYGIGIWHGMSVRYYGSLSGLYQMAGLKGMMAPFVNAVGSPFVYEFVDPNNGAVAFGSGLFDRSTVRHEISPMIPLIGMTAGWMVVLLAVPVTRQRAKLRSAHVFRAGLMSLLVVFGSLEFAKLAMGLDRWAQVGFTVTSRWQGVFGGIVMPILGIWLLVFWAIAIKVGWRIRRCGLLIFLGSIVSFLSGFAMLFIPAVYLNWL
jgi:hypothetical protein